MNVSVYLGLLFNMPPFFTYVCAFVFCVTLHEYAWVCTHWFLSPHTHSPACVYIFIIQVCAHTHSVVHVSACVFMETMTGDDVLCAASSCLPSNSKGNLIIQPTSHCCHHRQADKQLTTSDGWSRERRKEKRGKKGECERMKIANRDEK